MTNAFIFILLLIAFFTGINGWRMYRSRIMVRNKMVIDDPSVDYVSEFAICLMTSAAAALLFIFF